MLLDFTKQCPPSKIDKKEEDVYKRWCRKEASLRYTDIGLPKYMLILEKIQMPDFILLGRLVECKRSHNVNEGSFTTFYYSPLAKVSHVYTDVGETGRFNREGKRLIEDPTINITAYNYKILKATYNSPSITKEHYRELLTDSNKEITNELDPHGCDSKPYLFYSNLKQFLEKTIRSMHSLEFIYDLFKYKNFIIRGY